MSNFVQGYELRNLKYGFYVKRAAKKLPDNTTETAFTITGGPVLITGLVGRYVTAADATATTLQITTTATGSTGGNLSTAVSVASSEIGVMVGLTDGKGGALIVGATAGVGLPLANPFSLNTGTIVLKTVGTTSTGTVEWYLTYVPLNTGAAVATA